MFLLFCFVSKLKQKNLEDKLWLSINQFKNEIVFYKYFANALLKSNDAVYVL